MFTLMLALLKYTRCCYIECMETDRTESNGLMTQDSVNSDNSDSTYSTVSSGRSVYFPKLIPISDLYKYISIENN